MGERVRKVCSKCEGMMHLQDYLTCVSCGYVDYSIERKENKVNRNPTFKGNVHFVRYAGEVKEWVNKTIMVTVGRNRLYKTSPRPIFTPECPFCNQDMEEKMKHGFFAANIVMKNKGFFPYTCENKHRISMHTGDEGFLRI